MTVSSATNRVSYNGNSSTTVFAYTFKIFDEDDLTVIIRAANGTETTKTITTHYTVSGVGNSGGGNVTMLAAPATGETLVILREQDLIQELDIVPNDPFPADSVEAALDKLTFMVQQHEETLGRTIKASRTNTITGSEFTISAASRANKLFAFDSSGNLSIAQELGTYRGNWAATTAYNQRDLVKDGGNSNVYFCNTAHTSSGTLPISTNTDVAKWDLILDVDAFTTLYDQFDDRYLGAKNSDPATDNDGNTLIDGALYWNTTDNRLKVYDLGNTTWKYTAPSPAEQANIDALGPIAADVSAVAAIDSDVTTVAGVTADVTTVAGIAANVTTVAGVSANVTTVAGISADVTSVAAIDTDVTAVANVAANVTTVAGISADVTTVAGISADVTTVATNVVGVTSFAERYRVGGTEPSTSLDEGDLFYDTANDVMKVYNGSAWEAAYLPASGYVTLTGTETLTNKTLTDPAIVGTILEDVYTITDGAAFEIDPGNGSIQLITLGASRTPKATNFAAGESVTLLVDDGTAYTLTWTDATFGGSGVVWKTDGGVAPTLNTSGYTVIVLFKVGSQVYGARVGDA